MQTHLLLELVSCCKSTFIYIIPALDNHGRVSSDCWLILTSCFSSASQNDYRIDANQELLAIGVTNIMGSFVSAYPVTGSFGRFVCERGREGETATERTKMLHVYSVMFPPHIQDSGELPDWCLHSSWRDRHQWVLTLSTFTVSLPPSCGGLCYHISALLLACLSFLFPLCLLRWDVSSVVMEVRDSWL